MMEGSRGYGELEEPEREIDGLQDAEDADDRDFIDSDDEGKHDDEEDDDEEELPRDALLVQSILRSMGATHNEPRVIHQFLHFWYRFVVDVLGDAQLYSEHAGKSCIDCNDLKLALQSSFSLSFLQPPSRETLLELARVRNKTPLPKAISGLGIALPPDQEALLAPNYQLFVPVKSADEMDVDEEENRTHTEYIEQSALLSTSQYTGQRKVTFSLVNDKKPRK